VKLETRATNLMIRLLDKIVLQVGGYDGSLLSTHHKNIS
jgi:hypothetical protein